MPSPILESGSISPTGYQRHEVPATPSTARTPYSAAISTLLADCREAGPAFTFLDEHVSRLYTTFRNYFSLPILPTELCVTEIARRETARLHKTYPQIPVFRLQLLLSPESLEILFSEYQPTWRETDDIELWPVAAQRHFPQHKLVADKISLQARAAALRAGMDEALLISPDGHALEGAWSNFFWVDRGNTIFTAPSQVLPGVVRQKILNSFPCTQQHATLTEIRAHAAEAFVTQGTSGITAVRAIGGVPFAKPTRSTIQMLRHWYADQLQAERTV